jgi:AcrR family transcriptional regulator
VPGRTKREPERLPDGAPGSVVRRAPFSDNPAVGARGLRTQQRIVDAALRVFAEAGYHQCTIDQIATRAGCSRVSFYQYFSGKEELFRHLAGQVARQLSASAEALDPITHDAAGWASVRAWIARHGDIYERYEPVFHAFDAAAASDEAVAGGSARFGERNVARLRSRLTTSTNSPRQLDAVITLVLETVTRSRYITDILGSASPAAVTRSRVDDALADVVHRTFFGLDPAVNVHPPGGAPPPLRFDPTLWGELADRDAGPGATTPSATLTALVEAGREVFVRRGYLGTRIDDVVSAAGISHGAFYRYFPNKAELVRVLAARAMRHVARAITTMPTVAEDGSVDRVALRRWLRDYYAAHAGEAAMFRVWVDATLHDPTLDADSAPALDWGRRRMARFLQPRRFGDVDA